MAESQTTTGAALEPCPLKHHVSAGLKVYKTGRDPRIICLDCGLSLAAPDWITVYERWQSRSRVSASVAPTVVNLEAWTSIDVWLRENPNATAAECRAELVKRIKVESVPASTVAPQKSLLRDPVRVEAVSPLVVTRDGVPCPDQAAALEEFKQACLASKYSEREREDAELGVKPDPTVAPQEQSMRSNHFDDAAIERGFPSHISKDGTAYYRDGTVLQPRDALASPAAPTSSDAWATWFERLGKKASAGVVNATAELVTNERLAALVQAKVLPSSVDIRDGVCKCGLDKDDPIHSFSTEWQKMHAFTPKVTPPSTRAKAAAEEIGAWIFMLEQPLTSETDLRVATDHVESIILKRCFAEGEDTK